MQREPRILSKLGLEFFNRKPSFWLRNGSIIILMALLCLAFFYTWEGSKENLSSPLIYQAAEVQEQAFHLTEDSEISQVFVKLNDNIKVGDSLFALANPETINKIQNLQVALEKETNTVNDKIKLFRKISIEEWPSILQQDVDDVALAIKTKKSKGLSKSSQERILEMETEVVNSMKESQSLRNSLPKFEAMRDAAQKAFQAGKLQYSQGSIERSKLESLKKKLDETISYIKIRKSSLKDHQRLIYNFNRQIDSARAKASSKSPDYNLIATRFAEFNLSLTAWLEKAYLISDKEGKIVELISKGPAKSGDLLYKLVEEDKKVKSEAKLTALFSKKYHNEIKIGQLIILKIKSDTFEKEIPAKVELKEDLDENQFVITISPTVDLDFENTLITEGDIIISKPQRSFLSKVWSNFT